MCALKTKCLSVPKVVHACQSHIDTSTGSGALTSIFFQTPSSSICRVLRKKAYKPLSTTVPDHAIGNAFLRSPTPVTRPFGSPVRERFGSPPRRAPSPSFDNRAGTRNLNAHLGGRASPELMQTMRSETPFSETLRVGTPVSIDTRSSRHIHEMMSSQGVLKTVGSAPEVEKKKAGVMANKIVYQSPRWGSVQRTAPFDRKALPSLSPTAKTRPSDYHVKGNDQFMQTRTAMAMRTQSFVLAHGSTGHTKKTAGADPALRRKMDNVSRYYENLAHKRVPQLLRDRRAGLEMTTT